MSVLTVRQARVRRHKRVRKRIFGTVERPRRVVFRSNRGIEALLVDDIDGKTLAAASWLHLKKSFKGSKTEQAAEVGKLLAANARLPDRENAHALFPAAKPPVRDSGPVEGVWGNREVSPASCDYREPGGSPSSLRAP